ncbi:Zinc finger C2H2-type protein, partial [Dioscorea alata]
RSTPEGNPLDLNNLPEEYGKQPLEESSTTTAASTDTARFKKKKGSGKDDAKVYECRFCSLKFCKSQALERETETLNRARQLVFSTDGGHGSHIGLREMNIGGGGGMQSISPGSFQHRGGVAEQCLPLRPMYPRLPTQPYVYPSSSSSSHHVPYPAPYPPPPPHHPPVGDYFIGHVISGSGSGINSQRQAVNPNPNYSTSGGGDQANYTCYGAPLPQNFQVGDRLPITRESATTSNNNNNNNQGEGLGVNWSTSNPSFVD